MKKFFLAVAALAMLATSCTKDETTVAGGESLVSFTIDSPELATRYGEGTTATNLEWAFYDETGAQLTEISGSIDNFSGKHTINVALVDGRQYTALFWASAPAAPYTVDWANKKMSVTTTGLTANNEAYDAFYKYTAVDQTKKVHKIELTRPFAQINIATADTEAARKAGVVVASTKVVVKNAYKTLDLVNGEVSEPTSFEFGWATKATGTAKTSYDMLAMNYVLVNTRELVNVTMEASENTDGTNAITRTYSTVPVQRNYQTFILGNLLTTSNEFEVETKPGFDGEYPKTDLEKLIMDIQTVGGEFTLTEDVVLEAPLTLENNVEATINLNGKTISYTNPDADAYTAVFMVKKGVLTIEGEGNVVANGVGNIAVWAGRGDAANDGKVIIKGGNFSNNSSQELIYTNNKGVIEIYGGTFSVAQEDQTSFAAPQFAVLNLYGNGKTGNDIIVYGGTFHKFNPADNISENPKKNFVAEGYSSVADGDNFVVVPFAGVTAVADTQAEIRSAIKEKNAVVYVYPTEDGSAYLLEGKLSLAEGVKLIGAGDEPVALFNDWGSDAFANQAHFTNTHIENIHFTNNLVINAGIANGNVTFKGCVFGGHLAHQGVHFDSGNGVITFEDCTFVGRNMLGASLEKVIFNNCKFENKKSSQTGADKWTGVNMWGKYEFNNCEFDTEATCNVKCDGVEADFNNCFYSNGKNIKEVVLNSPAHTCTIKFDGAKVASTVADFSAAIANPDVDVVEAIVNINAGTSPIEVNRDLEINMNNKTLNAGGVDTKNPGLLINGEHDLAVNDANIVGGGIYALYGANVVFDGGSLALKLTGSSQYAFYAASNNEKQSVVTIKGGDFSITGGGLNNSYICAHGNAVVYIEGGNFAASPATRPGYAPFIVASIGAYNGQIIITGGTFGFDPSEWVADGYNAVQNGSVWTVSK